MTSIKKQEAATAKMRQGIKLLYDKPIDFQWDFVSANGTSHNEKCKDFVKFVSECCGESERDSIFTSPEVVHLLKCGGVDLQEYYGVCGIKHLGKAFDAECYCDPLLPSILLIKTKTSSYKIKITL